MESALFFFFFLLWWVHGLLIAVASLVAEQGSTRAGSVVVARGLSSCGSRAQ